MFLHPELGSDSPIGSDLESGCDILCKCILLNVYGPTELH